MNNLQSYNKETVQRNYRVHEIHEITDKKGVVDKSADIVSHTFEKQSEGVEEIFKKIDEAISTPETEKCE